jgi:hypothetical protein
MKLIMLLAEPFKLNDCNKQEGEKEKKKLGLGGCGVVGIQKSSSPRENMREMRECKVRFLGVGSNGGIYREENVHQCAYVVQLWF